MGTSMCRVCGLEKPPDSERCLCGFSFRVDASPQHKGFRFASDLFWFIGLLGFGASLFILIGSLDAYGQMTNLPIVVSGVVVSFLMIWLGTLGPLLLDIYGLLRRILDRSVGHQ